MLKHLATAVCLCTALLATVVVLADDSDKPDAPKSPAAVTAEGDYNKAKQSADKTFRATCLAAENKLIEKLKIALVAATKSGSLPEANAIDAEIKAASQRVDQLGEDDTTAGAEGPAKPEEAPKSPAAVSAKREYEKAKQSADKSHRTLCLGAEHKLIDKLKIAMVIATKNGSLPEANAIDAEIKAASLRIDQLNQTDPSAGKVLVRFSENMGYTVTELKKGVSTHNNDARPITEVSRQLFGKMFTQEVTNHASSVSFQFVTAGKVYVLAEDGSWYPSQAIAMKKIAQEERKLSVRDSVDGFHVWSITGQPGEKFDIPFPALLVADGLEKVDTLD